MFEKVFFVVFLSSLLRSHKEYEAELLQTRTSLA